MPWGLGWVFFGHDEAWIRVVCIVASLSRSVFFSLSLEWNTLATNAYILQLTSVSSRQSTLAHSLATFCSGPYIITSLMEYRIACRSSPSWKLALMRCRDVL